MKNWIIALAVALMAASCSLDEKNTSYATEETYYRSVAACETGIVGCYNPLRTIFAGNTFFQMTEGATDLMILNLSQQHNAICNITPSRPGVGLTVWQYGYQGVMRCNAITAAIGRAVERGDVDEADAQPLLAEAVVLRAFYYYLLTSTFGDCPFYTCEVTDVNREEIAHLPRMSASKTRDYLIDELKEWLLPAPEGRCALPLERTYAQGFRSRLGAAAGLMIAGKFCMWEKRWDDALAVYGALEDIYGHYDGRGSDFAKRYPLTDIPFRMKYTDESIVELANVSEEYGMQVTGSLACFTTPLRSIKDIEVEDSENGDIVEEKITDIYNGIAIPEMGGYARTYTSHRPTKYYYQNLMGYNSPDLRSGAYSNGATEPRASSGNLAWRWSGYDPTDTERTGEMQVFWFTTTSKSGNNRPWLGDKFWCFGMFNTKDSNNYKIFRYAGVLLNLAEVHLNKGDLDAACRYLNITRVRAGLAELTPAAMGGNADAIMEEIRMECARELFGEYQRKFDLVRWGIWYERTLEYNDGMYLKDYIRPCHRYWPIPADQVTYSGNALDNKEYEQ